MDIPQIANGKKPDEAYNPSLLIWLPPDSPYGNLQLKQMNLSGRLDEANRRLQESWLFWNIFCKGEFPPNPINAFQRHYYANEQAIYLIRRATDEIIALTWCLSKKVATGKYPKKIKVDCIGKVLKQESHQRLEPFKKHGDLFRQLNNISNAFKHSFVNSNCNLLGSAEPSVYALSLEQNDLSYGAKLHGVSLAALVTAFNIFYEENMVWLREFSERNRLILEHPPSPIS
jgi:hypothetical protein